MAKNKVKCPNCGKKFTPQKRNKTEQKYCSRKCFYDTRFGKTDPNTLSRNPLYSEVIKLCRGGFTQSGAAKHLGIPVQTVYGWFSKYKQEQIFSERTCQHCGKSLIGMKNLSSRKYCSAKCSGRARYLREHEPCRQRYSKEFREKALELYKQGHSVNEIARHFGMSRETIHKWIHKFGGQIDRVKMAGIARLKPLKLLHFNEATTSEEWRQVLRESMNYEPSNDEILDTHIVCEKVYGQSGFSALSGVIFDCLHRNPCSGETFAFCDKGRHTIIKLKWTGTTFCSTRFSRQSGRYLWPDKSVGLTIEVSEREFEYLLSYQKKSKKIQKRLDFMRNL